MTEWVDLMKDKTLTTEEMQAVHVKLELLQALLKQMVSRVFGPDYQYAMTIRHKTEPQSLMVVSGADTHEELSAIITEAYQRHNDGSMLNETDLQQKATH